MSDVTQILVQIGHGDHSAAERLLPIVYDELRRLAAAKLADEKPGQTLQSTALVHEAYLRLVGDAPQQWSGRNHFFAAASEAMRRILVDVARRKAAVRHGGQLHRQPLDECAATAAPSDEILAVHEALDQLAALNPDAASIVKLHYFAGFSLEEAAQALDLSRATAYRLWTYARTWLRAAWQTEAPPTHSS